MANDQGGVDDAMRYCGAFSHFLPGPSSMAGRDAARTACRPAC
ncbi:hypothetical protein [uncultured Massilia sp.]|nr:hypothetical protein [uncultured Massilia sp.]